MEYTISKKKLHTKYSHVSWAKGAPYWISDASYSAPQKPIELLHHHNMYEMGICMRGSGEYRINDRVYRFREGDIAFVNHFTPHFSNSDNGNPAKWKMVFFDPISLMQLAGMLDPDKVLRATKFEIPFSGIFRADEHPKLTDFIKAIIEQGEIQDDYSDLSIAFSIGNFVIACTRYFEAHPAVKTPDLADKKFYYKITPAISRISTDMANASMVEEGELASLCKMSVSNLRRLFKQYTGLSPKAFITNTRISYAEYLLSNTDMTVIKIANEVGYSEVSGFNRTFKSTFGMTPSAYRTKNRT